MIDYYIQSILSLRYLEDIYYQKLIPQQNDNPGESFLLHDLERNHRNKIIF